MTDATRSFRLVVNPNAGIGRAAQLAEEARTRLKEAGVQDSADGKDAVVLFGGDGTIAEWLAGPEYSPEVPLVVVPCGTANALSASFYAGEEKTWSSLEAALKGDKTALKPVPLARVNGQETACVIVSTALHASILHDSELMRKSDPSIDRFKKAAMKNVSRLYPGRLQLEGYVRRYSPAKKAFYEVGHVDILDDFSYVLLGAMTDRLEPTFVVAPLRHSDESPGLDVVAIRQSRRPATDKPFAEVLGGTVTLAMYDKGKHVDLVYDGVDARPYEEGDHDLEPVVEYYRCDSVEWTPTADDKTDEHQRLLCIDGALQQIPAGGSVRVEAHDTLPQIWV